jgi:type IV pilus assembly protein PilC
MDRLQWISSDSMLMLYVQLSNMIGAGLTILTSLTTLAKQVENKTLNAAIADISHQVEGGSTLSHAFATHPAIFSRLFVNMVKAGESSGNLDKVLMRYAEFFEKQQDLKQKVRGAMFYPMILLAMGVAVCVMIVTFVIPQFAAIYMKAGIRLPVPTLVVYDMGIIIKRYWYMIIAVLAAIIALFRYYFSTEKGTIVIDSIKLRMPILGPLYRKAAIARLSRTLATLLGSGVPILEALDITKDVAENEILAHVIASMRKYVEKGDRMSEPMKVSGEFPPDVVQMVAIGEETGSIDSMLNKVADFYDMNVSYAVKKLTTLIEPVFLLIMGLMVGAIMASMLLPMFDMVKTLKQ